MADRTSIEWTDATWNPIRGCSRVSEGCRHCYAERPAARFAGSGNRYDGLVRRGPDGPQWTGRVRLVEGILERPLHWRRPRRIFVNSMSDLFHEQVPLAWIARIFNVMAAAKRHTFQVLTKRADRMSHVMSKALPEYVSKPWPVHFPLLSLALETNWPLSNVWLGVSVENQATADERLPFLLQTPAAIRWVSHEPALGPVNFGMHFGCWCGSIGLKQGLPRLDIFCPLCDRHKKPELDWLVVGGESGPGARPFDLAWARAAINQCREAGVPVFVKQLGRLPLNFEPQTFNENPVPIFRDRKGSDPAEWPTDLRVRQYPAP